MSPDTVSSLFPDRPIRPLPKRRLRERLSPEVADSIQYPPTPQQSSSLFYYPYSTREEADSTRSASRERNTEEGPQHTRRNGTAGAADGEGEDDVAGARTIGVIRPDPELVLRSARAPSRTETDRQPNPKPPHSATSPGDGYDLFENTNNKKKRKMPNAGETTLTGSRYAVDPETGETTLIKPDPDMEGSVTSGASAPCSTSVPYYMSSSASGVQNVPGPGRGRYGRVRNGKSPLRSVDANWSRRNGSNKLPALVATSQSENTGIISSAIANAEKVPPEPGQENISLLHQQQAANALVSAPFTFTCDSQVPGSLGWPGDRRSAMGRNQSSPTQAGSPQQGGRHPGASAPPEKPAAPQPQATEPAQAPKRSISQDQAALKREQLRKERKELQQQARERQRQTQLQNKLHPPKPEDIWICEACEYEAIFGEKPRIFIKGYERKEWKERRDQERRKAALAKRLQNTRKGAKKSRSANKQSNMNQQAQYSHDSNPMHQNPEEPYEDEYDEDDVDEYEHDHDHHCEDCHHEHVHNYGHDDIPPLIPGDGGGGGNR